MSKIGLYTVGVSINGVEEDFNPTEVSFHIKDSIYEPFCRGSLTVNDVEGIGLESRAFTMGSKIALTLGYDNNLIKTNFVVNSVETQSLHRPHYLNGILNVDLIHESFSRLEKKTAAYDGSPSDIVGNLFRYTFDGLDIERTQKAGKLYRPYFDETDFIQNILIKNSISTNTALSPYFFYIDSHNTLNYKSFSSMMDSSPVEKLFYGNKTIWDNYYENLYGLYPFSEKLEATKPNIYTRIAYLNQDTLGYAKEVVSIPSKNYGPYPIYDVILEPNNLFDKLKSEEDVSKIKLKAMLAQKNSLLPEKMIAILPLYTNLKSGQTIAIEATYGEGYSSYAYSDKLLIERANHVWEGDQGNGYTQLILGNPSPRFAPNSLLETQLEE